MTSTVPPKTCFAPLDWALAFILAALAAAISTWGFGTLGAALYNEVSFDVWFQADTPRVIANLTDAASNHYRTAVHPIPSILLTPIVLAMVGLGVEPILATKILIIAAAATVGGLSFAILRFAGLPRVASCIFTLLLLSSAGFIHWYSEVELSPVAGATICLSLLILVRGPTQILIWPILVSAATLGITTTNWTAGLAATFVRWPFRRFVATSVAALLLVTLLSVAQYFIFHNAKLFFHPRSFSAEMRWTQPAIERRGGDPWKPLSSLRSLAVAAVIAPEPIIEIQRGHKVVTNQSSGILDNTWYGIVASLAWIALLAFGLWGALRQGPQRATALGLGLMLVPQALLYSVYGSVTFAYAPHVLPITVTLASLSWFTPWRHLALALAVVTTVAGGVSNIHQFRVAAELAKSIIAEGGNSIDPDFAANGIIAPAPVKR